MEAGTLTSLLTVSRARGRGLARLAAAAPVALVTIAGAVLRLWSFDRVGGNPFYDAAVRSMSLSWHNLVFGAFEPGGQVSVDKAPADLWLQVAGVKLLGFTGAGMRLPEVLAGIAAIPLLYDLVRRLFGRSAGLGAAATLAVLPAAILTSHSDTMDSVMMACDLLAAWLVVVGAQRRSIWPVVAAGAAVGLAFNVKLFEALIVVPALALFVLLAGPGPLRRRLLALGGAGAAMVCVGLGWVAIASLTPLGGRPWPIGSADGSIWNVVFAYNGLDRLSAPASAAALKLDPPGLTRLFSATGHDYLAIVGTTLLAAALVGGAALVVAVREGRRPVRWPGLPAAGAAFFGTWLVTGFALLSDMQRMQPRYLEAVTPAIAAIVGIAVGVLAAAPGRTARLALAGSVGATAVAGVLALRPPGWAVALALGAAIACGPAASLPALRRRVMALATCGLVAVLAVPAAGAVAVAREHRSDAGLPSRMAPSEVARASAFLVAHQGAARYEVASPTVVRAAPLIVRDGRPVLMLTSIDGRPLLTPGQLARAVLAGRVRYGLLGRGSCATSPSQRCAPVVRWALAHSHDTSAAAGLPRGTLYSLTATARPATAGRTTPRASRRPPA